MVNNHLVLVSPNPSWFHTINLLFFECYPLVSPPPPRPSPSPPRECPSPRFRTGHMLGFGIHHYYRILNNGSPTCSPSMRRTRFDSTGPNFSFASAQFVWSILCAMLAPRVLGLFRAGVSARVSRVLLGSIRNNP